MEQEIHILLIEDSPLFVELARAMLAEAKSADFAVESVDNLAAGIERLAQGGIEVVLLDLTLPDSSGLETFTRLHAAVENVPTVIYTNVDDEELSLSALQHGAADYLVKSEVNANWLARSLVYAIQRSRLSQAEDQAPKSTAAAMDEKIQIKKAAESETRWVATLAEKRLVSISALDQMKARLLRLLGKTDCDELSVDMSRVEYVANAAISMLLIIHKRSAAANKRLVLCEMTPHVHEQFSSRRLDKVFDIRRA